MSQDDEIRELKRSLHIALGQLRQIQTQTSIALQSLGQIARGCANILDEKTSGLPRSVFSDEELATPSKEQ